MIFSSLSINLLGLAVVSTKVAAVPYDEYILTPNPRTLVPASVYNVNGSVTSSEALTAIGGSGSASFGPSSAVTYDFKKNIAGIVSFNIGSIDGDGDQFIGISFTESSLWINENGCDATGDAGIDEALWFPVMSGGYYKAETQHQRDGTSVLTDGAKRDRLVWPGDIAISGPSVFVSTNDMITIKNSLDSLLVLQNSSGALPYAGIPFTTVLNTWSFTYHLHSLIDIHDYYLFTGDLEYLQQHWGQFKLGMNFSLGFIDETKMANLPKDNPDWLRVGMGGHNIEANSILYYTLNLGTKLSKVLNDLAAMASWSAKLYRDNDSLPLTTLHPQDGNAWAIFSGLVDSPSRALQVSDSLAARWNQYGAPAPECGGNVVSPFVSVFEIQAHYLAGRADRAVKMIKFMWGDFMLDDPRMTNSTFIEGYSTDGTLHYAPYANDPRVSHAHGWSTGPTSALTFHGAGLMVTSGAGKTWSVAPNLGG
ncbi:hypothetical protein DID88_009809 [Monilinia fructigena]|uniref:Alpha-L-rhamnosidase six-hairpin glycosidase domain-containing protein n=1 Tax=Monilinia fructigena TaxID=38457 RepID=A0A395ICL0_9HELO|nr:hypothetical protein DID88_009809 [Monilinia fructigena]